MDKQAFSQCSSDTCACVGNVDGRVCPEAVAGRVLPSYTYYRGTKTRRERSNDRKAGERGIITICSAPLFYFFPWLGGGFSVLAAKIL